ncbi:MAG: sugar diacid recognition domain-containing protein [Caldibacillus thermoamylovorans]|uniref:CdaR family transcriptional regulator n=1 Tax=Caldibacillus TaxID=1276290 RepID=UPI001D06286D|nr:MULTISPECIES: sugar diacid recognition domain-containing protein [Caldibacillus]MCB7071581.1 helix-turn-helix domain-containing protein [Caldibacillus sp. 210928-DFI.2.22]MCB7075013.1 helix-turn-helix domain-containing protein [Caldibacillus sp. 210928-DFI.2.18]MCM3799602.1 helix-turn-helix domain-containing protein [Caldibacillus thermoamylovorans]
MYRLTANLAQMIVNKMMKDIPYNINIMDKNGVIIGSGNKERIGILHHGAVDAIRYRKAVEIKKDEEFVKKGINLPIEMNGDIIGVVGISGEIGETRPFGNLVRSTVILLIEQSVALEKANQEEKRKYDLFNRIMDTDTLYTKELAEQAKVYGLELNKPSQIVYVESQSNIDEINLNDLPTFKITNDSICIVVQEIELVDPLITRIQKQNQDVRISISGVNDRPSKGYIQAKSAMRVLRGLFSDKKIIFYTDCEVIADISEWLKQNRSIEKITTLLEKNEELCKTLQVYLNSNLNSNEAAGLLNIHRNTLNYRLEKIQKITGKDPKNILELVELLFILINRIK